MPVIDSQLHRELQTVTTLSTAAEANQQTVTDGRLCCNTHVPDLVHGVLQQEQQCANFDRPSLIGSLLTRRAIHDTCLCGQRMVCMRCTWWRCHGQGRATADLRHGSNRFRRSSCRGRPPCSQQGGSLHQRHEGSCEGSAAAAGTTCSSFGCSGCCHSCAGGGAQGIVPPTAHEDCLDV